jgi:hypothetical protein
MTATMKRRLERLEARVRPAHTSRVVRLWSGHYNEAGELVKDRQTTNRPDGPNTFDIIITAPRIDPATGRAIIPGKEAP